MIDIRDLYEKDYIGKEITISGWIRNHRKQAHFGFIDLSDGTYFKNLQVVYDDKLKKFDEIIETTFPDKEQQLNDQLLLDMNNIQ